MPLLQSPTRLPQSRGRKTTTTEPNPRSIADELHAYIAIRDDLLAKAEKGPTPAKLHSAAVANEFVKNCLQLPRATYRAQHLVERDTKRERERCEAVEQRLNTLRSKTRWIGMGSAA